MSMVNPISLEVFRSALTAIAEEMGAVLTRSSYSPNIKERRDFSCALFDQQGRLVAQAEHIPGHLGAMPHSVQAVIAELDDLSEGDTAILNDPFRGGTHLPDITLASPVFWNRQCLGFIANRAHHSDVGGETPGSMSPLSTDIHQEGVRIQPVKLMERGKTNRQVLDLILSNVRTPKERMGDLKAQESANTTGEKRFLELVRRFGLKTVLV